MTELSTNGVSQYGVEERRQQITLPTSRGQHLVRTQNTRPAVPSPKPPVTTTNAWSNEKPASQVCFIENEHLELKKLVCES